jgi:hypothetical protein
MEILHNEASRGSVHGPGDTESWLVLPKAADTIEPLSAFEIVMMMLVSTSWVALRGLFHV